MWFNLKLKPGTSACAERIQFGVFVFIFQCLACVLQKFNPMRVKHNSGCRHDLIVYLTMSQQFTVFSEIRES